MQLASLNIVNFKNIASLELLPSPKLTCLTGSNGMGKTNVLDAIYLLSMCKSSAGLADRQCIRRGGDFFALKAHYIKGDTAEHILCTASTDGAKTLKRNGKAYQKITEHIGLLPLVMVSPYDSALISEAGDERRRYLNSVLAQTQPRFLPAINRYNALLAQRNKALKTPSPTHADLFEAIDVQLAQYGQDVYEFRGRLVELLQEPFARYYGVIAGGGEAVALRYVSDLHAAPLAVLLAQKKGRDMALQFTASGVHRDDLEIKMEGCPVRRFGSQGQQKSVLLALKLAQADVLKQTLGIAPILLLDDIFDKLDALRIQNLMHLLSADHLGQIFLTDTSTDRISALLHTLACPAQVFEMKEGGLAG